MTKQEALLLIEESSENLVSTAYAKLRIGKRSDGYTNPDWFLVLGRKEEGTNDDWTVLAIAKKDIDCNKHQITSSFSFSGKGFNLLDENVEVFVYQEAINNDVLCIYKTLT